MRPAHPARRKIASAGAGQFGRPHCATRRSFYLTDGLSSAARRSGEKLMLATAGRSSMNGWVIALIVAAIVLIGVLAWAVVRMVGKVSRLLESVTQVTNRLQRHEVIEKVGVVLAKFADIEEIAKDKLGVDQRRDLEEMKTALEELRSAMRAASDRAMSERAQGDLGRAGAAASGRAMGGAA
jgi:uncharacterized protein YoxC